MADRYRCGPKNSNWHKKWPIDIGAVPKIELMEKWLIDIGATPKTQTELTRWWSDQVAQSQMITRMTMQANLAKKDMPQYDNSWGSTTRSKDTKAWERSDDPREGGYGLTCNSRGLTTRSKGEWILWKVWWYQGSRVCPSMTTRRGQQLDQKGEWNLWKVW